MAGLLGVGSGMDLESLVSGLVSTQRDAKAASFDKKIADLSVELSAIGSSSSSVSSFNTAVKKLNDPSLFNKRKADITQPDSGDALHIQTNSEAVSGRYEFDVVQVAQGSRSELMAGVYQSADDVITGIDGKLAFTAGNESFTVEVEAGTTLAELAMLISEAEDNFGVTTSLIDTGLGDVRLIIMSDKMGTGNDLFVTTESLASDTMENMDETTSDVDELTNTSSARLTDITGNLMSTRMSQNGIILVEGTQIQSENNDFDNVIKGLSIEALNPTESTISATISYDTDSVKEAVQTLVDSYNQMIDTFNGYTGMNGTLQGNSLLRGLESSLANTLNTTFEGEGKFTTLYDIGIRMGSEGELLLNNSKLDDALASGFSSFADMFTGEQGIAAAFENTLRPYTGSDGLFRSTQDSLREQIGDKERDLESFEYRMEEYENGLRKKYALLDTNLAELNASGDYLRNQLASLSK